MIRKNNQPIVNVYLNGYQINEIYSGGHRVYPDQIVDETFWLKVKMSDNTYKYCYCRITSKTQDSSGNITNLYYEVIQTQVNDPGTEYYEYSKNIYKADSAIDYTDVTVTNGMDPDELYDIIPQINQKITKNDTKLLYKYGLLISNMEGVDFGCGKTTDYDKMEFFLKPVNYGGASWFGVINTPSDNNDFRLFGASNYIYFDCGSGRIYKARITNSYMLKITLVSGGVCTQSYTVNGSTTSNNIGTSVAFSRYTGTNKDITLGANDFYFFGFRGYKNDQMLNDIVVLDSDIENGILNKVYDRVKKQYTTLSITPSSYMTNNWPYTEGSIHEIHGNVLDNFNIGSLAYNSDKIDNAVYKFYYVYVLDSLNNMNYTTGAKYVDSVTYYTQNPTIFYDENQYRVEAYGDGDITLYVDDTLVSNPYYFTRPEYDTEYNVVAFAQESGKEISDPAVYSVLIEGYKTPDPVITYNRSYQTVTADGYGTVLLYKDGTSVSNPYTFDSSEMGQTFTFTATAQESGKQISNVVSETITLEELTNPVFVKISDASEVNSGECDILVVCDKFGIALDGTKTVKANGISVTIQQDGTIENTPEIANAVLHYDPFTLALTNVNNYYLGGNTNGATWGALSDTQFSAQYQIVISNNENKDNRPVVGNNEQTNRALLFNNQNKTETLNAGNYYIRWYTKTQAEWTSELTQYYWPVYIYKLQS